MIVVDVIWMVDTPIIATLLADILASIAKMLIFELFVWLEFMSNEPATCIFPAIIKDELAGLA